ncbi:MAG: VOC family protein [Hyphomicrobiaceae bacterium]|nr:VOC family protein [Hyphomicrobiaceae bacterium]
MTAAQKITPCLWFDGRAEEAALFYTSIFPDSRIDRVHKATSDYPGGKEGGVLFVEFTLAGQSYQGLNGGPHTAFNDAVSLSVSCTDQAEVDRYWEALIAGGGKPVQCGWLQDKYGLRWQIIPEPYLELMRSSHRDGVQRAMAAMMTMVKLDIAALRRAYDGA